MKALWTVLGIAGGAFLILKARSKPKPLTFSGKAMLLGGRLAVLSAIGCRAFQSQAESLGDTVRDAAKQSVKAWRAAPRLSIRVK